MSMLGDTLLGDLMSMNCETEQPFRVGLGFSYDEIQARCKAVVREDSLRGSVGPDTGQLPPLSGSYYDQGLGANIVNVDEPRQVVLSKALRNHDPDLMYKLNLTKFLRDKHPGLLCPGSAPAPRHGQDHEEADSEEKAAEARDLRRQRGAQTENVPHTKRPGVRRSDDHMLLC